MTQPGNNHQSSTGGTPGRDTGSLFPCSVSEVVSSVDRVSSDKSCRQLGTGATRSGCTIGAAMLSVAWNRRRAPWGLAVMLFLLIALSGCAAASTMTPTPLPTPIPVTVSQLIAGEGQFAGKKISMNGTVLLECTTGCWFFLDDGTGKIYIDLATAGLHIPQKVGSRVTLVGNTSGSGGQLRIEAEEVRFPE